MYIQVVLVPRLLHTRTHAHTHTRPHGLGPSFYVLSKRAELASRRAHMCRAAEECPRMLTCRAVTECALYAHICRAHICRAAKERPRMIRSFLIGSFLLCSFLSCSFLIDSFLICSGAQANICGRRRHAGTAGRKRGAQASFSGHMGLMEAVEHCNQRGQ